MSNVNPNRNTHRKIFDIREQCKAFSHSYTVAFDAKAHSDMTVIIKKQVALIHQASSDKIPLKGKWNPQ